MSRAEEGGGGMFRVGGVGERCRGCVGWGRDVKGGGGGGGMLRMCGVGEGMLRGYGVGEEWRGGVEWGRGC